jgi:hypothetical protein
MKRWIAVAAVLAALLLVPSAFAGGDHDGDRGESRSYQGDDRDHDGDTRDHGSWKSHGDDDDDDDDDRDRDKGDRDRHDDDGDHGDDDGEGNGRDDDGDDDGGDDDGDDDGEPQKPTDVCPNLEGLQTSLPPYFVLDAGQCAIAQRVITITVASGTSAAPAAVAGPPSVVQVTPQAATPKVKKKITKKAKKAKNVKKVKKAERAKARNAKRTARRGVKGLRAKLPRLLPFTR